MNSCPLAQLIKRPREWEPSSESRAISSLRLVRIEGRSHALPLSLSTRHSSPVPRTVDLAPIHLAKPSK
jgi:hypothetical protein